MPPKKRNTRKTGQPTAKAFRDVPLFNKILDEVATAHDHAAGRAFEEVFASISELVAQHATEKYSADSIQAEICGPVSHRVAMMVTRQVAHSPIPIHPSKNRRATKKSLKSEPISESDEEPNTNTETPSVSDPPTAGNVDMEFDTTPVASPQRGPTPPISSEMTDEEFESVAVPNTLKRMQQMSISRKLESVSNTALTPLQGTPRRNPPRNAAPSQNVFPTTPGRNATTSTLAPRTPHRVPFQYQPAETEVDKKQKHADELRNRVLAEKKEKARKEEEKRNAVMERKKEQERQRLEKIEEMRKKEERQANFLRQQKEVKSPTRMRIAPDVVRTPSSKSQATRKVFPANDAATPGRGPAKRGRIEVAAGKGRNATVAQPTVKLSPSRALPRNTTRQVPQEAMEVETGETTPRAVQRGKPKAKAKRSVKTEIKSPPPVSASSDAMLQLQADQERYLMEQAAAEKARIAAEEQKRLEKKLAAEKAEAARRRKKEEEMARLLAIQKEEELRLRQEREREEAELQATLARQAEKKARQEALGRTPPPQAYEMTPPRTYQPNSKNDYGLNDLNSDDETDQEDDPRKEVPEWADFAVVRQSIRKQIANPPFDLLEFFGEIEKPNLREIFGDTVRPKKRGSSAVWKSPAAAAVGRPFLRDISE
uniref:INCENP_ARK-bind domain-containing protein n=1 Tax=Caenorhabditis japonica TaxID=281687 RepID=A0A8R1DJG0_CAEJA